MTLLVSGVPEVTLLAPRETIIYLSSYAKGGIRPTLCGRIVITETAHPESYNGTSLSSNT